MESPWRWVMHTVRPLEKYASGSVILLGDGVRILIYSYIVTAVLINFYHKGTCNGTSPRGWDWSGNRGKQHRVEKRHMGSEKFRTPTSSPTLYPKPSVINHSQIFLRCTTQTGNLLRTSCNACLGPTASCTSSMSQDLKMYKSTTNQ